jgi:dihydrofolate reductase
MSDINKQDEPHRKSIPMRKLIESTLVSLDGVIEAPERWAIFDEEATQRSMQELDNYDAFLMGRVTYERFRDNWSSSGGNPYLDRIGAMPKYVASRSLTEVTWNATLLGPDVVAAIEELKAQPGKDFIKYGNSRLDATLLRAGLVDELRVWIMPVVVGSGQRIFEDVETSSLKLTLADVNKLRNGSVVLSYMLG